ncbi:hypothetical protein, partial [Paenibacillus sp. GCM10027626]|uniref:hypothetical protein n=1 Tax=Paenibacillus sp. GCM10027626 TaxID=3273411 RepID=UPI00362C791E
LFHETASFRLVCGDKHYIDWTVFFISFLPFIAYLFLANQQAYAKCNISLLQEAEWAMIVAQRTAFAAKRGNKGANVVFSTTIVPRTFHVTATTIRTASGSS